MGEICMICGKNIWFNCNGMRLTTRQEERITGIKGKTTMYMEGEFAHQKCFFNRDNSALSEKNEVKA